MKNLNASEFDAKISEPDVVVFDVRTELEFKQSHIQNSINLNVLEDDFYLIATGLDRSKNYALYCRSGKRSLEAGEVMMEMGFKSLYNLSGGIIEWIESGRVVIS